MQPYSSTCSHCAMASKKLRAEQPQAKVKINYQEPKKTGFLQKAGKTNKSFKNRFFVLYKNFLVYYDDEQKWKRDITVDRLEVRRRSPAASSMCWPCAALL